MNQTVRAGRSVRRNAIGHFFRMGVPARLNVTQNRRSLVNSTAYYYQQQLQQQNVLRVVRSNASNQCSQTRKQFANNQPAVDRKKDVVFFLSCTVGESQENLFDSSVVQQQYSSSSSSSSSNNMAINNSSRTRQESLWIASYVAIFLLGVIKSFYIFNYCVYCSVVLGLASQLVLYNLKKVYWGCL